MEKKPELQNLHELSINTLRFLAVDAVEKAKSGHPGMPMGDSLMAYVLWTKFLRHNPKNPKWPARDRFVLSAGHGSMLLYALLHLTGYDISMEDIKNFRQWGSPTPGHPEYDIERGIETTTGPLGQGFSNAVGMAIAQKYLVGIFNKPGSPLFDYHIYAITSDGDMMEGVSNEAASIAGHLKLASLICLYSDNRITIEGSTELSFSEDVGKKFEAFGWHVQKVDGNSMEEVEGAITKAKAVTDKPSLIIARTHIGFGSPGKADTAEAHGAPLGIEEVKKAKANLNWRADVDFYIPDEVLKFFRQAVKNGEGLEKKWHETFDAYSLKYPELAKKFMTLKDGKYQGEWTKDLPGFDGAKDIATRIASGKVLDAIAKNALFLIGGSADLAPSNNTYLNGMGDFLSGSLGRNIHYGVREHAMGSIMNGIALSGLLTPFGGTFLVFSDYMRPAIRLASLSKLHCIYVFTHDSIGLGEDGPTHQPIEQIASLRAIPNLLVIRPSDALETVEAWKTALLHKGGPVALILTRQVVPVIDRGKYGESTAALLSKGAYVIADSPDVELIIIATGSEVHLCLGAWERLKKRGIGARVVAMPSWELFEGQDMTYKMNVLPPHVKTRLSVEAAIPMGWHRYTTEDGGVMGITTFGASAPAKILFEKFGFTIENIEKRALELLMGKKGEFLDRL